MCQYFQKHPVVSSTVESSPTGPPTLVSLPSRSSFYERLLQHDLGVEEEERFLEGKRRVRSLA